MKENLTKCWMCGKEIDEEDKYCRHCGKGQNENAKLPYSILGILALFLVVGPFCLINLWKSPLIKKEEKPIIAAIIGIITVLVIGIILYGIFFIINYYVKMFNLM